MTELLRKFEEESVGDDADDLPSDDDLDAGLANRLRGINLGQYWCSFMCTEPH